MRTHRRWVGLALVLGLGGCEQAPAPTVAVSPQPTPVVSLAPSQSPSSLSDGLGANDAVGIGSPRFVEAFSEALDENRWRALKGLVGSLDLQQGHLRMSATSGPTFPYLATKAAVIPATGPWAIEWAFTWKTFSPSVVFALDFFPPVGYNAAVFSQPFVTLSPVNDFLTVRPLRDSAPFRTPVMFDGKPHRVRFEGGDDLKVRAYFDGILLQSYTTELRPLRFWVGSFPVASGGNRLWADLSLDFVVAGSLERSLGEGVLPPQNESGATATANVKPELVASDRVATP